MVTRTFTGIYALLDIHSKVAQLESHNSQQICPKNSVELCMQGMHIQVIHVSHAYDPPARTFYCVVLI